MGVKTLLLLLLVSVLAALGLAADSHHGHSMPGAPVNISQNDRGLQQVVLNAAYSFNNQSNDAYLFKPSAIRRAQKQIVKGVRYIIDLEISRTVCHKRRNSKNLSKCDFQPKGPLHQTFQCHFEFWMIPWKNENTTQILHCKA
ncbi:cystatin-F [Mastacembelus armatus]|uniref:Cystatin F n=1 Tax=Mastacembelus armatus TaxID=205130 RepID=A0A3Q3NC66_9TELE|nr:cystatin-F [Mastacembelus armatus]